MFNKQGTFLGHPRSLFTLFNIELWERFSFYGMQSILMLYLYYSLDKGGLGVDKALASGIVGAYGASVYLATVAGAWLADRIFGLEKMLFASSIVVMMGHMALGLLSGWHGLLSGLILVALGSGGLKASANAIVGLLYDDDKFHSLRDAGFSIFYIAINIGALLGPLLTGYLQNVLGFHYGFMVAALGMALGLIIYTIGRKSLPDTSKTVPYPLTFGEKKIIFVYVLLGTMLVTMSVFLGWLNTQNFKNMVFWIALFTSIVYFVRLLRSNSLKPTQKRYIWAYIPLFITVCIFWSLWFQFYTAMTVYFDEVAIRKLGSFEIPVSWLHALQGLWVILFSGVMAALWTGLGKHQPKTSTKFAFALILVSTSFSFFVPYLKNSHVMPLWLIAFSVLILTIGELCLSPISLSLATKIAPIQFRAQMVALNFLSFSLGFALGGRLSEQYFRNQPLTIHESCDWLMCERFTQMLDFYYLIISIGLLLGIFLLSIRNVLNRYLQGID